MATTTLHPAATTSRSSLYDWITTTDHKKIGIMYLINSFLFFLFIIPILAGFGNYVVPLQIGAPDMAFPRINALSLWMLPLAGILLLLGFVTGGAAAAGWTSYSPLSQDRPLGSTGA